MDTKHVSPTSFVHLASFSNTELTNSYKISHLEYIRGKRAELLKDLHYAGILDIYGNVTKEWENVPLPPLLPDELKIFTDELFKVFDFEIDDSLKISFSMGGLSQAYIGLSTWSHNDFWIPYCHAIGGYVKYLIFTKTNYSERVFQRLGIAHLHRNTLKDRREPDDIDIRIKVDRKGVEPYIPIIRSDFIQFQRMFAYQLTHWHFFTYPNETRTFEEVEGKIFAYFQQKPPIDSGINRFWECAIKGTKIELIIFHELTRTSVFTDDLYFPIDLFLKGGKSYPISLQSFRKKPLEAFMHALLGLIKAENPETINQKGFFKFITALSNGGTSSSADLSLEPILMANAQGITSHLDNEIEKWLDKHYKEDSLGTFAFLFNLFLRFPNETVVLEKYLRKLSLHKYSFFLKIQTLVLQKKIPLRIVASLIEIALFFNAIYGCEKKGNLHFPIGTIDFQKPDLQLIFKNQMLHFGCSIEEAFLELIDFSKKNRKVWDSAERQVKSLFSYVLGLFPFDALDNLYLNTFAEASDISIIQLQSVVEENLNTKCPSFIKYLLIMMGCSLPNVFMNKKREWVERHFHTFFKLPSPEILEFFKPIIGDLPIDVEFKDKWVATLFQKERPTKKEVAFAVWTDLRPSIPSSLRQIKQLILEEQFDYAGRIFYEILKRDTFYEHAQEIVSSILEYRQLLHNGAHQNLRRTIIDELPELVRHPSFSPPLDNEHFLKDLFLACEQEGFTDLIVFLYERSFLTGEEQKKARLIKLKQKINILLFKQMLTQKESIQLISLFNKGRQLEILGSRIEGEIILKLCDITLKVTGFEIFSFLISRLQEEERKKTPESRYLVDCLFEKMMTLINTTEIEEWIGKLYKEDDLGIFVLLLNLFIRFPQMDFLETYLKTLSVRKYSFFLQIQRLITQEKIPLHVIIKLIEIALFLNAIHGCKNNEELRFVVHTKGLKYPDLQLIFQDQVLHFSCSIVEAFSALITFSKNNRQVWDAAEKRIYALFSFVLGIWSIDKFNTTDFSLITLHSIVEENLNAASAPFIKYLLVMMGCCLPSVTASKKREYIEEHFHAFFMLSPSEIREFFQPIMGDLPPIDAEFKEKWTATLFQRKKEVAFAVWKDLNPSIPSSLRLIKQLILDEQFDYAKRVFCATMKNEALYGHTQKVVLSILEYRNILIKKEHQHFRMTIVNELPLLIQHRSFSPPSDKTLFSEDLLAACEQNGFVQLVLFSLSKNFFVGAQQRKAEQINLRQRLNTLMLKPVLTQEESNQLIILFDQGRKLEILNNQTEGEIILKLCDLSLKIKGIELLIFLMSRIQEEEKKTTAESRYLAICLFERLVTLLHDTPPKLTKKRKESIQQMIPSLFLRLSSEENRRKFLMLCRSKGYVLPPSSQTAHFWYNTLMLWIRQYPEHFSMVYHLTFLGRERGYVCDEQSNHLCTLLTQLTSNWNEKYALISMQIENGCDFKEDTKDQIISYLEIDENPIKQKCALMDLFYSREPEAATSLAPPLTRELLKRKSREEVLEMARWLLSTSYFTDDKARFHFISLMPHITNLLLTLINENTSDNESKDILVQLVDKYLEELFKILDPIIWDAFFLILATNFPKDMIRMYTRFEAFEKQIPKNQFAILYASFIHFLADSQDPLLLSYLSNLSRHREISFPSYNPDITFFTYYSLLVKSCEMLEKKETSNDLVTYITLIRAAISNDIEQLISINIKQQLISVDILLMRKSEMIWAFCRLLFKINDSAYIEEAIALLNSLLDNPDCDQFLMIKGPNIIDCLCTKIEPQPWNELDKCISKFSHDQLLDIDHKKCCLFLAANPTKKRLLIASHIWCLGILSKKFTPGSESWNCFRRIYMQFSVDDGQPFIEEFNKAMAVVLRHEKEFHQAMNNEFSFQCITFSMFYWSKFITMKEYGSFLSYLKKVIASLPALQIKKAEGGMSAILSIPFGIVQIGKFHIDDFFYYNQKYWEQLSINPEDGDSYLPAKEYMLLRKKFLTMLLKSLTQDHPYKKELLNYTIMSIQTLASNPLLSTFAKDFKLLINLYKETCENT